MASFKRPASPWFGRSIAHAERMVMRLVGLEVRWKRRLSRGSHASVSVAGSLFNYPEARVEHERIDMPAHRRREHVTLPGTSRSDWSRRTKRVARQRRGRSRQYWNSTVDDVRGPKESADSGMVKVVLEDVAAGVKSEK